MPRRPEDPRITDLRRYRKARALQRRQPPPRPGSERLLGGRRGAGLILLLMVLTLLALWLAPVLIHI
jgi:hypothetical protein